MQRRHILLSGRVQGVWFRESTKREADRLGVTGWIRNLPDGRVESVVEGTTDALAAFESWCRQGPPKADVQGVTVESPPATGEYMDFEVTR